MKCILKVNVFLITLIIFSSCKVPVGFYPEEIIESPNGEYKIELWGRKSSPNVPLVGYVMNASIKKNNKQIGYTELNHADWMDPGFEHNFNYYKWESDSVFALRYLEGKKRIIKEDSTKLHIKNNSKKVINFLNVRTAKTNRFLFIDIDKEAEQVSLLEKSTVLTFLFIRGMFENGKRFTCTINFSEYDVIANKFEYEVFVSEKEIKAIEKALNVKGEIVGKNPTNECNLY